MTTRSMESVVSPALSALVSIYNDSTTNQVNFTNIPQQTVRDWSIYNVVHWLTIFSPPMIKLHLDPTSPFEISPSLLNKTFINPSSLFVDCSSHIDPAKVSELITSIQQIYPEVISDFPIQQPIISTSVYQTLTTPLSTINSLLSEPQRTTALGKQSLKRVYLSLFKAMEKGSLFPLLSIGSKLSEYIIISIGRLFQSTPGYNATPPGSIDPLFLAKALLQSIANTQDPSTTTPSTTILQASTPILFSPSFYSLMNIAQSSTLQLNDYILQIARNNKEPVEIETLLLSSLFSLSQAAQNKNSGKSLDNTHGDDDSDNDTDTDDVIQLLNDHYNPADAFMAEMFAVRTPDDDQVDDDDDDGDDDGDDEKNPAVMKKTPQNMNKKNPPIGLKGPGFKLTHCANPIMTPTDSLLLRGLIVGTQMELLRQKYTTTTLLNSFPKDHYPTNVFLSEILKQYRLPEERRDEFAHAYVHIAQVVEGMSNGQLSIQPFGSVPMGLGGVNSDLDCRIVLNPEYTRVKSVNKKDHYANKPAKLYEGPLPSLWTSNEIEPNLYGHPVLPLLSSYAVQHFFKKLLNQKKVLELNNVYSVNSDIKLLSFSIEHVQTFDFNRVLQQQQTSLPDGEWPDSMGKISREKMILNGGPIDVDLVSSNDQPLAKTQFFRDMIALSPYTYPLIILLKHWAKQRGILEASMGYLNSFSLATMVIFFLQIIGELPVLHKNVDPNPHINNINRQGNVRQEVSPFKEAIVAEQRDDGEVIDALVNPPNMPLPSIPSNVNNIFTTRSHNTILSSQINSPLMVTLPLDDNLPVNSNEAGMMLRETRVHEDKLTPYVWTSPMTQKSYKTYAGSGQIPSFTKYMITSTFLHKYDDRKQYKLVDDASFGGLDLEWRFDLIPIQQIIHSLPSHCQDHFNASNQLAPLNAALYVPHSVVRSWSAKEREKYYLPAKGEAIKLRSHITRYFIPQYPIPAVPLPSTFSLSPFPQAKPSIYGTKKADIVDFLSSTGFSWGRLVELLGELFYFYGFVFNPDLHVVSVRTGHLNWIHELLYLNSGLDFIKANRLSFFVEDPFNPLENSAKSICASYRSVVFFEFKRAAILLSNSRPSTTTPNNPSIPLHNVFVPLSAELLALYQSYKDTTHCNNINNSTLDELKIADIGEQCTFNASIMTKELQSNPAFVSYLGELYGMMSPDSIHTQASVYNKKGNSNNNNNNNNKALIGLKKVTKPDIIDPKKVLEGLLAFGAFNYEDFKNVITQTMTTRLFGRHGI